MSECGNQRHDHRNVADRWLRWKETKDGWVQAKEGLISIGVIPMVPFITGRRKGASWTFHPPMKAALEAQLELFIRQSALKFAETMACFPMLSANGVTPTRMPQASRCRCRSAERSLVRTTKLTGVSGSWNYVEPNTASPKAFG